MYERFCALHSPKWSSGKLPLSGGRGGAPLAGTEANEAIAVCARERGSREKNEWNHYYSSELIHV